MIYPFGKLAFQEIGLSENWPFKKLAFVGDFQPNIFETPIN
jgi:hypothetical protein